jgi:hypothetical protein
MLNPTTTPLGDAHDEPDTGKPPCIFCKREIPCECADEPCMCTCGRCLAPIHGVPFIRGAPC